MDGQAAAVPDVAMAQKTPVKTTDALPEPCSEAADQAVRISHSTDSMVTVRLSNSGSPRRVSLKLVTDDQSTGPQPLTNPIRGFAHNSPGSNDHASERSSLGSLEETAVDWSELERSEKQEPRDNTADESTTFLLARLEKENSRLVNDPKAARPITESKRPPSLHQLKRMMDNPDPATLRYSMLPSPPPLTDLDFYAALVNDYPRTAMKLPFLLSKKVRGGIPPPLRGVIWISMSGARASDLENIYDRLQGESSPYEHLIGKDLGRTFPSVDIFSTTDGDGQRMLGRVLKAFSVYDPQIGYCQGLGFLVGPLLMHMGEREAFCVLIRLMENYELRSCFLPRMYGLQLRLYQLSNLISIHLPDLSRHLSVLGIQTEYATQWFLSFFAVTCPLPMLLRIYDVIFLEGAAETIMRVALSLLRRNQARLLSSHEFEEVMQMLLARGLWDTYKCSADDLVSDFTGLTGIVTKEGLAELEKQFALEHPEDNNPIALPPAKVQETSVQATASRFLGRFWALQSPRDSTPMTLPSIPGQQMASQGFFPKSGAPSRGISENGRDGVMAGDPAKSSTPNGQRVSAAGMLLPVNLAKRNKDSALDTQIEDLLMAMSGLQREHAAKVDQLHALQQERDEERKLSKRLVSLLAENIKTLGQPHSEITEICTQLSQGFQESETESNQRPSYKDVLLELDRARERLSQETSRVKDLQIRLSETDNEVSRLKGQVAESRARWQESQKERQRLERSVSELKARKDGARQISADYEYQDSHPSTEMESSSGLRSFKLNRSNSNCAPSSTPTPTYNKRSSSLGIQQFLQGTENQVPASPDSLLLELVQAKTSEAAARQEAEEARAKLEAMRRMLSSNGVASKVSLDKVGIAYTPGQTTSITSMAAAQSQTSATGAFGRWAAWGRKSTPSSD